MARRTSRMSRSRSVGDVAHQADGEWLAGVFDRAAATCDEVAGGYRRASASASSSWPTCTKACVLDVACGRGGALVPAARAAGATGSVHGGDLSPRWSTWPRRRSHRGPVRDGRGPGRRGPRRGTSSFDRVLCAFGLFFLPHSAVAVAGFRPPWGPEVGSPCRPGVRRTRGGPGRTALRGSRRRPRARSVDPLDDAEALHGLLDEAGFADVQVHAEQHDVTLADADEWWAWKWSTTCRACSNSCRAKRRTAPPRRAAARDAGVGRARDHAGSATHVLVALLQQRH